MIGNKQKMITMMWLMISRFYIGISLASTKVNVSVYYETLCPDSIKFITKQLHPTYGELGGKYIDLDLIPYMVLRRKILLMAHPDSFTCLHGHPNECYGTKIHGCVLYLETINVSEAFINCAENSNEPASTNTFENCAKECGVLWSKVEQCMASGLAEKILRRNGVKTRQIQPKSKWVPTVVFNNSFNESDSNEAQANFIGVVCRYLQNEPEQCKGVMEKYSEQIKVELIY